MPVTIVTDTTHYMPREVVEAHGLELVSLYVNWNGRQDRESDLPDLRRVLRLPAHGPGGADDLPALDRGLHGGLRADPRARGRLVSIHLSGGVSGTVRSAMQARDELAGRGIDPARIEIVDSARPAPGWAPRPSPRRHAARRGATAAEAAAAAQRCRAGTQVRFALGTLEFLRRGGRMGAASAMLGTALKIKPILSLEEEVRPIGRVRTWSRAFDHLVGPPRGAPGARDATPGSSSTSRRPTRSSACSSRGAGSSARAGVRLGDRARDRHLRGARGSSGCCAVERALLEP
jgi:fatty acid-binding protein DegV